MKKIVFALGLALIATTPALAQDKGIDAATLEKYTKAMWPKTPEGWESRIAYDDTMKICSETRNQPSDADFAKIKAREAATVKFPADGNVLGDYKSGLKIANNGRGGTFTDKAMTNGANCYACHQLDLQEVSYGTLGPSLHLYGKNRGFKPEEAKAAYAKIYNSMGTAPCTNMPRFGYHGFLTEQQMKDLTAMLFDPNSPVNK